MHLGKSLGPISPKDVQEYLIPSFLTLHMTHRKYLKQILYYLWLVAINCAFLLIKFNNKKLNCLREHFNTKHKKSNTNDSASKAKSHECSGKKYVYQSSIKNVLIFSLIFPLCKYFCKCMHQECPV